MGGMRLRDYEGRAWFKERMHWTEGNEHFVWIGEGDVDHLSAPKVFHGNRAVNVRRLLFEDKIRKLSTWEHLRVTCVEPKCCLPAHMTVVSASQSGKERWANQVKVRQYKWWSVDGARPVAKASDLSEVGLAAFSLMKMIILEMFDDWSDEAAEMVDVDRTKEYKALVLDIYKWSDMKKLTRLYKAWGSESLPKSCTGVLDEPLMQRVLAKNRCEFEPTTLPAQMIDRIGQNVLILVDEKGEEDAMWIGPVPESEKGGVVIDEDDL